MSIVEPRDMPATGDPGYALSSCSEDEHLVGNTVPNPAPEPFIWPSDHAGMVATLTIGR